MASENIKQVARMQKALKERSSLKIPKPKLKTNKDLAPKSEKPEHGLPTKKRHLLKAMKK